MKIQPKIITNPRRLLPPVSPATQRLLPPGLPEVWVVDNFDVKDRVISGYYNLRVSHGDVVSGIISGVCGGIKQVLFNAPQNPAKKGEFISDKLIQTFEKVKEKITLKEKTSPGVFRELNLSLGPFEKTLPVNEPLNKVREALTQIPQSENIDLSKTLIKILNSIKGFKRINIAAGNFKSVSEARQSLNILTLADNATSVGALDSSFKPCAYSAVNHLDISRLGDFRPRAFIDKDKHAITAISLFKKGFKGLSPDIDIKKVEPLGQYLGRPSKSVFASQEDIEFIEKYFLKRPDYDKNLTDPSLKNQYTKTLKKLFKTEDWNRLFCGGVYNKKIQKYKAKGEYVIPDLDKTLLDYPLFFRQTKDGEVLLSDANDLLLNNEQSGTSFAAPLHTAIDIMQQNPWLTKWMKNPNYKKPQKVMISV